MSSRDPQSDPSPTKPDDSAADQDAEQSKPAPTPPDAEAPPAVPYPETTRLPGDPSVEQVSDFS